MPQIENNLNTKNQFADEYISRKSYDWAREQRGKDNKETFVYATVAIAAIAVYATWAWMIIQKIKA